MNKQRLGDKQSEDPLSHDVQFKQSIMIGVTPIQGVSGETLCYIRLSLLVCSHNSNHLSV